MSNRSSRCGFTLLELVAVIAMTSALMLVAVALLRAVLDSSRRAAASATHAGSIMRMEQSLRGQLRRGTTVVADGVVLAIEHNDGRATWTLVDDRCEMQIDHPDGPRFERFDIGPHKPWRLEVDDGLAELVLAVPDGKPGHPFRLVVAHGGLNKEPE